MTVSVRGILGVLLLGGLSIVATSAHAADMIRVGKPNAGIWALLPPDIATEVGIWPKYGIEVETIDLGNGPKMFQALTSDSVDFGLGTGADMGFTAKGAPFIAVAAFARDARSVVIATNQDSPIKSVADLKGKLVAMPGVGSVGDWLIHSMSVQEGWGPEGAKPLALGSSEANIAALRTHQVDATIGSAETMYLLESQHVVRIVVNMAKYQPNFFGHTITARNKLIASNPDLVERFLKGFFASVAYMKANRDKTIEMSARFLRVDPAIVARTYDEQMPGLEEDGTFDPKGIEVAKQSLIDMGILTEKPATDKILTTRFLPVKP